MKKRILVVARSNKVEALRVAAGLTLLDDSVRLVVLGELEETPAAREQLEVLEFADVPVQRCEEPRAGGALLAREVLGADMVYVL